MLFDITLKGIGALSCCGKIVRSCGNAVAEVATLKNISAVKRSMKTAVNVCRQAFIKDPVGGPVTGHRDPSIVPLHQEYNECVLDTTVEGSYFTV